MKKMKKKMTTTKREMWTAMGHPLLRQQPFFEDKDKDKDMTRFCPNPSAAATPRAPLPIDEAEEQWVERVAEEKKEEQEEEEWQMQEAPPK